MKKIIFVVLIFLTKFSLSQNPLSLGAYSNYSYNLISKTYQSYPNDFKVFDTLVNVNYFSIFISKQYEYNSEVEYELMPFNYYKSKLVIKELPSEPYDGVDYAKNYTSYLNIRYKYSFFSNEKRIKPMVGLSGGISFFQRSFSSYANSYLSKSYPINDITLSIPIGAIAGLNFKVSDILNLELSLPYNFMSFQYNSIHNKNPMLQVKDMHSRKLNVNFMEHSYMIRFGLRVVIK